MRNLEIIPTCWVHLPSDPPHECIINEADVPEYRAKGFILGKVEDERSRQNCAKMVADALADKAAADGPTNDIGSEGDAGEVGEDAINDATKPRKGGKKR